MTTAAGTVDETSDGELPNSSNIWGKSHRILERNDSCFSIDFGSEDAGSPDATPKASGEPPAGFAEHRIASQTSRRPTASQTAVTEEDGPQGDLPKRELPNGISQHTDSKTQGTGAAILTPTASGTTSVTLASRTESTFSAAAAESVLSTAAVDGSTASADESSVIVEDASPEEDSAAAKEELTVKQQSQGDRSLHVTVGTEGKQPIVISDDSAPIEADEAHKGPGTTTPAPSIADSEGLQPPTPRSGSLPREPPVSEAKAPVAAPSNDSSTIAAKVAVEAQKAAGAGAGTPVPSTAGSEGLQPSTPRSGGSRGVQPATPSSGASDGAEPRTPGGSALSPASRPFVPGKASPSPQTTPRKGTQGGGAALNVNAAAFVPQGAAKSTPSGATAPQFGDLPDSLNPSPLVGAQEQSEWPGKPADAHTPQTALTGEDSGPGDQGEWSSAWMDHYEYPEGYTGEATYANGYAYYQADESWGQYNAQAGEDGQWGYDAQGYAVEGYEGQGYPGEGYAGEGYSQYSNGYHQPGQEQEEGSLQGARRRGRVGRGGRRGGDRRRGVESRGSWSEAAVDVLEQQFGYSRESLHEMLELHEGNLEVALDMLAQLEAESEGQLPATGQDAPQLTEENFPSLGGSAAATPAPPTVDFAAALKAPASGPPGLTRGGGKPAAKASKVEEAPAASPPTQLPWVETGAAVSQAYDSTRADARDHARLRNQYFQEATKAFLAGRKALARDLGAKGREQSQLMKAAHVQASQAIYKHRNPVTGRTNGKGPGLVDLHGLHAKEAVAILGQQVEAARRSRSKNGRGPPSSNRLSVLVGTGHHTKGSRTPARLPAAVEEWLTAAQIPFTIPGPGVLELTV